MELPSETLKQIAVNTKPKIVEHILIVREKSSHEEHLYQLLQTNNKQFKATVTILPVKMVVLSLQTKKKSVLQNPVLIKLILSK